MLHCSPEAYHEALQVISIWVKLLENVYCNQHNVFIAQKQKHIFMSIYLFLLQSSPPSSLWICFYSALTPPFLSLFPGSRSHPPSLRLPNSPSVQRQGTGSRHWLDFHTIPSTERHIKLIRVNNCGGALLSRALISLAWPGSGHTDGLVISDLGAEGMDEGGGIVPLWVGDSQSTTDAVA